MSNYDLSQEEFEKIESFLLGKMNRDDANAFSAEMNSNSELALAVKNVKLRIEAVEEIARKKKLEQYHQNLNTPTEVRTLDSPFSKLKIGSVAASILVLIGISVVYYLSQTSSTDNLYTEYYSQDPGLLTPMGSAQNYEFFRGMVDYKQAHYDLALERWQEQWELNKNNDSLNFYIGLTLLAKHKTKEAIPYLNKVNAEPESIFIPDVYFYLGLAQLKEGNLIGAKESLKKNNSTKALELLEKLNH